MLLPVSPRSKETFGTLAEEEENRVMILIIPQLETNLGALQLIFQQNNAKFKCKD